MTKCYNQHKRGYLLATRPIDRFYKCYLQDVAYGKLSQNCRGINDEQFKSADRLSHNYQRAFLGGNCKPSYPKIQLNIFKSTALDSQASAITQHNKVFSKLSVSSRQVVDHVCLQELPIGRYEGCHKLSRGMGIIHLRSGLDELTELYRTIA